eukprot:1157151-Pelagomonas_calceolata.AAC.10
MHGRPHANAPNCVHTLCKTCMLEPAARWFFQQLVIGLDYCHRKGVVNRDIKLENTLLQMVPVSTSHPINPYKPSTVAH